MGQFEANNAGKTGRRLTKTQAVINPMITEIAFTGAPVTDIKRARKFYEEVLGLKPGMESAGGAWVEYEIGNGTFAIGCYGDSLKSSSDGIAVAFEADDYEAEIARLKSLGVPFAMETMPTPVCHFAIISDPDGTNIVIYTRR